MIKIAVVSGSSGGHLFPALAFIDAVKKRDEATDILLVLPKRQVIRQIFSQDYKSKYISPTGTGFSSVGNFLKACLESLFLLIEFKPSVVVGFGGIDSIPLLLLAWLTRTKKLIHEQNAVPGRANKLLAKFADRVALSFHDTGYHFRVKPRKLVFTGNPLRGQLARMDKAEALDFFGFGRDKFTILVMGGSQGAHKINTVFLQALNSMQDKDNLQIIHICGNKDFDFLSKGYEKLNLKNKLFPFLREMGHAYSAADLAVCRAGATTIAELIFFKTPAIIIPYPFAKGHQAHNAKVLEKCESCVVIEEDKLDAYVLKQKLQEFSGNRGKIGLMHSRYSYFTEVDSGKLLADEVLALAAE